MIPFPGESRAVEDAVVIDGGEDWTLSWDISHRAWRFSPTAPGHRVISSGEEWRAWVYPGSFGSYMEGPGEDVVVSWVVEVLSGTVTLSAAEGFDPAYGDTSLVPSVSLGSHTVTGPATLVIPSTFTGADVWGSDDALMLVLAATSGNADIQQVKLRVWPPGGALGGWGDLQPGFNSSSADAQVRYVNPADTISGSASNTDPEAAWDAAYAAFTADVTAESASASRTISATAPGACYARQTMAQPVLGTYSAGHELVPNTVILYGADWTTFYPISSSLVEEVDWIVPPNEVFSDTLAFAQQIGSGSTGWLNAEVTVSATGDMPGEGVAMSEAGDFTPVGGAVTVPLLHGAASGTVALDTSGKDIAVTISHGIATGSGSVWPGWTPGAVSPNVREDVINYSFGDVETYAVLPSYRAWSPTATVVPPLRQRNRGRVRSRLHGDRQRSIRSRGFL